MLMLFLTSLVAAITTSNVTARVKFRITTIPKVKCLTVAVPKVNIILRDSRHFSYEPLQVDFGDIDDAQASVLCVAWTAARY